MPVYELKHPLIEHKLTFIVQNINFLIAALTGIVAISSVYKMYF